jgi:hypothetical protein
MITCWWAQWPSWFLKANQLDSLKSGHTNQNSTTHQFYTWEVLESNELAQCIIKHEQQASKLLGISRIRGACIQTSYKLLLNSCSSCMFTLKFTELELEALLVASFLRLILQTRKFGKWFNEGCYIELAKYTNQSCSTIVAWKKKLTSKWVEALILSTNTLRFTKLSQGQLIHLFVDFVGECRTLHAPHSH